MTRLDDRPMRTARIVTQETAGATVLLDPSTGEYHVLDDLGARLWALCDGASSIEEISRLLCGEYRVSPATMAANVLEILTALASDHLITYER
jgi:hypothetical protein